MLVYSSISIGDLMTMRRNALIITITDRNRVSAFVTLLITVDRRENKTLRKGNARKIAGDKKTKAAKIGKGFRSWKSFPFLVQSFIESYKFANDQRKVPFYKEIFSDHFYDICSKCVELELGKQAIRVFSILDMFQYCSLISNMLIPEEDRKDEIIECISRSLLL